MNISSFLVDIGSVIFNIGCVVVNFGVIVQFVVEVSFFVICSIICSIIVNTVEYRSMSISRVVVTIVSVIVLVKICSVMVQRGGVWAPCAAAAGACPGGRQSPRGSSRWREGTRRSWSWWWRSSSQGPPHCRLAGRSLNEDERTNKTGIFITGLVIFWCHINYFQSIRAKEWTQRHNQMYRQVGLNDESNSIRNRDVIEHDMQIAATFFAEVFTVTDWRSVRFTFIFLLQFNS